MKKLISILSFAVIAVAFFSLITVVSATKTQGDFGPNNHNNNDDKRISGNFDPDKQLSKSACGDNLKNPVIDVTQKVQNDVDSGNGTSAYFPGEANYWNVESYTRHIKVWSTGTNTWCATVVYNGGKFNAFYKQTGPAGTGLIGSDVNGEMHGGYRATFTGTLAPIDWPTHGNVGTFDYNCDLHGNCTHPDWIAKYFPGYPAASFAQPWWGWIYNADHHGTWVNSSDGNSGNIL